MLIIALCSLIVYPLASDSTLEDFYREKPEGEFCPELTAARTRVWEVLRPYRMKLLRLAPAKFIHFGTTREILELMNGGVDEYHYLGWSRKVGSSIRSDVSGYNSVLSSKASVGKDCYLEVSYVHGNSRIGSHSVLSYIDVQDQVIPDNVVLHGLKQRNGKFIVRIFGVNDNPKENWLFGRDLDELEDTLGVRFWEENGQAHTLWSAALYQEADTIREATDAALELYEIVTGGKDFDRSLWTAASHKSLCAGFNEADPDAIIAWNKRMADMDSLRDWGYAKDYVECMWLIMQQEKPEDFVIATGVQHTVRDFTEKAFAANGMIIRWEGTGIDEKGYDAATGKMLVCVNSQWFRPTDVDNLWGDPTKAKTVLGWNPQKTSYEELVEIMAKNDRELAKREKAMKAVM